LSTNLELEIHETGAYYPVLYLGNFWMLEEDLYPINNTLSSLPLTITFEPISMFYWQMMSQFDKSLQSQASYGLNDGKTDDIKVN